jgi:hypothetical protein
MKKHWHLYLQINKKDENIIFFATIKLMLHYATQESLDNHSSLMEQIALKNVNNCLYTNIYSYLETSGGISYNPYLNVVHFLNTRVN